MSGLIDTARARQEYFAYLCSLVHADDPDCTFSKLMLTLFNMEFVWNIDNDVNRAEDGLSLRSDFARLYCDGDADFEDWLYSSSPCSVLEMLIALAYRIDEDIMWNPTKGNRVLQWFYEMLENLGLDGLSDDNWVYPDSDFRVKDIIIRMLDRTYTRNGFGGLFPLTDGRCEDQRKIEIWKQMNTYFIEKYGVEEDLDL